jgi:hypothetical protein
MDAKVLWSVALLVSLLVLFLVRFFFQRKIKHADAAAGFVLWQTFDNWCDFVLYPATLLALGPMKGLMVMVVFTLAVNLVYMAINKTTDVDWTFIEYINSREWVRKLKAWKVGPVAPGAAMVFIVLAIKTDSFVATTFLYGKGIDFRTAKFWFVFLTSHLIANLVWTGGWEIIFTALRAVF